MTESAGLGLSVPEMLHAACDHVHVMWNTMITNIHSGHGT